MIQTNEKWMALIIIAVIMTMGLIISAYFICNVNITWNIKMDDNTREWLVKNDYCIISSNEPYNSGKPSVTFMGECQYFNESLIGLEENYER